jgi:hypothetical protein
MVDFVCHCLETKKFDIVIQPVRLKEIFRQSPNTRIALVSEKHIF